MPPPKESTAAKLLREQADAERHKKAVKTAASNTRGHASIADESTPARKRREAEVDPAQMSPPVGAPSPPVPARSGVAPRGRALSLGPSHNPRTWSPDSDNTARATAREKDRARGGENPDTLSNRLRGWTPSASRSDAVAPQRERAPSTSSRRSASTHSRS
eukprot:12631317-Heterocapsa_arctica.AAC.1